MSSQAEVGVLLQDLAPCMSKPRWQNFLLLVVALQVARSFILWRIAAALLLPIPHESRYQRIKRVLSWQETDWQDLRRAWVRAAIDLFAPGLGPLVILTDWTLHTDRCRSLWVQLPVGGRGVPLAFWLTANEFGGAGKQREFEDAAFRELAGWLPEGRVVIIVGDRGFGGRERMRFFRHQLGWYFVLRVTGDARIQWQGVWRRLDSLEPPVGQRWQAERVRYGRKGSVVVNVVAVRERLPEAKPVRDWKGHLTGETVTETVWYLVTNLPLTVDVVALYALRMQIEQSFRDYKTEFGLEQERTEDPVKRLPVLLLALMVVVALEIHKGQEVVGRDQEELDWRGWALAPPAREEPAAVGGGTVVAEPTADAAYALAERDYPVVSVLREGQQRCWLELLWGQAEMVAVLRAAGQKCQRMQQRPQVQGRRKVWRTKRRRRTTPLPGTP